MCRGHFTHGSQEAQQFSDICQMAVHQLLQKAVGLDILHFVLVPEFEQVNHGAGLPFDQPLRDPAIGIGKTKPQLKGSTLLGQVQFPATAADKRLRLAFNGIQFQLLGCQNAF